MSQTGTPLPLQDTTFEEKEQIAALLPNQKEGYAGTRREIFYLNAKCTEIQSEHCTILTVPNEVICLIFENAQRQPSMIADENGAGRDNLMEVVVSHVCHHWRMISLGYPKLWSKFLCTDLTPNTLARFDAYMARSAAVPCGYGLTSGQTTIIRSTPYYSIRPLIMSIVGDMSLCIPRATTTCWNVFLNSRTFPRLCWSISSCLFV